MKKSYSQVTLVNLHRLLGTDEEHTIDAIIEGRVLDPATNSVVTITSWEKRRDGQSLRLLAKGRSLALNSQELHHKTRGIVILQPSPAVSILFEAIERINEGTRQAYRRAREIEACREKRQLELAEQQEREFTRLVLEYKNQLLKHVDEHWDEIRAQLQVFLPILPSGYESPRETLAIVAVDWLRISDQSPPTDIHSIFQLDPFLEQTRKLWTSVDEWDNMKLIRHFTDASFCLDALTMSIELEAHALDPDLRSAIRTSRLSTLSRSGLAEEADSLGMELLAEADGIRDGHLARTLWGHYQRWNNLDNAGHMMRLLEDYFRENVDEEPTSQRRSGLIRVNRITQDEMREVLSSS